MTIPGYSPAQIGRASLLGLAALLTVLVVVSLASGWGGNEELAALVEQYTGGGKVASGSEATSAPGAAKKDKSDKSKAKSPLDEQVERICGRHFFAPAPPKAKFSAKLTGLLGDKVFFDGKPKAHEVGQSYNGAKIMAIGGDWVEMEFQGKASKLYMFAAGGDPGSGPSSGPSSGPGPSSFSGPMPPGGPRVMSGPPSGPPPGARMMPPGFKLTPEMIQQFKNLSPEERSEVLEHMPAELREQLQ